MGSKYTSQPQLLVILLVQNVLKIQIEFTYRHLWWPTLRLCSHYCLLLLPFVSVHPFVMIGSLNGQELLLLKSCVIYSMHNTWTLTIVFGFCKDALEKRASSSLFRFLCDIGVNVRPIMIKVKDGDGVRWTCLIGKDHRVKGIQG